MYRGACSSLPNTLRSETELVGNISLVSLDQDHGMHSVYEQGSQVN
jgi:hypothetical protein